MLPFLLAAALAQEPGQEAWERVWESLLTEALDGDLAAARARYEAVLEAEGPTGDPSLALLRYRLGMIDWALGDTAAARAVLDACVREGLDKARCLDLRGRIDLEADAVHSVPVRWDFADTRHGFVHPRAFWEQGSIRIANDDGGSALVWTTTVDGNREDQLVAGFRDPTPAPKLVRIRMSSRRMDGLVTLTFLDLEGRASGPPTRAFRLPRGEVVEIVVRLAEVLPLEADTPHLDPARLHRMVLRDVTGRSGAAGVNELWIDEVEVR